ncbi:MAG: hypothetical protein ACKO0Z_08035 [Betaproteobacteria bacterium]
MKLPVKTPQGASRGAAVIGVFLTGFLAWIITTALTDTKWLPPAELLAGGAAAIQWIVNVLFRKLDIDDGDLGTITFKPNTEGESNEG